jgi:4-amino-4-deoxy-L-arabinose transferase-like glycosyltransferase
VALALLVLAQAGCLLALLATAWAAGWATWGRRSPERLLHPLTPAIGLALLGEAGLLLAALHLYTPAGLAAIAILAHAAAAAGWRHLLAHALAAVRREPRRVIAASLLAVAATSGGFLVALYPPSAFDETTYHLPFARAFLAQPGLPWVPELRVPAFPLLAEALQAALLAGGGERAPHQLALVATLLTAALLFAWGREAEVPIAGWLGAALFLGNPLVAYLAGTGYVDPLLGLFTTGCFYSLWRARHGGAGWAATAGLLAGAAAAVKYLGLYAVGVGTLAVLVAAADRRRRLFVFAATVALATAIPYGYLLWRTGNPLFPYFANVFGPNDWAPAAAAAESTILSLPFDAVFRRQLVGHQPPLSPALLLGSLVLLAALARVPRLRVGALVVAAFFAAYAAMPLVSRYLLAVLPLWALLAGAAASWAWQRLRGAPPPRGLAAALALAIALPGPAYGAYHVWQRQGIPASARARHAYLAEVHPGYGALAWLERRHGRRYAAACLACEYLHGFAGGRLLGEHAGPWQYGRLSRLLGDPAAMARELRAAGVTHLLLPRAQAAALRHAAAAGLFTPLHADADFEAWAVAPAVEPSLPAASQ